MKLLNNPTIKNIGGLWVNPVSGNKWLFSMPTAPGAEQTVVLKQTESTAPIDFSYSLLPGNGSMLLTLDGVAHEIVELTKTKMVFKIDEETSFTLYKEPFIEDGENST